ncbi:hypothetical protein Deipr_2476 (plasmid) [Deinococcus proteolyticus MRP]|uniref:Uncharacterized protein n=1 Tax=Deinococcus proteolyticus (strain ATCC 35074 / DSM 20540 / JCM 6276 / NBRC 101906 / NCIMB 13154 / VKM Ac-1939 / CCM 2703 / MRP) TaxID=693977 RepID=F0RQN4_DEIPM|nr:hypothetical protein [Deinococcus proteolyticus]ADY27593.1 hypothetical protein Deipr_2476 [Deinococcus proteolyticus MRP]
MEAAQHTEAQLQIQWNKKHFQASCTVGEDVYTAISHKSAQLGKNKRHKTKQDLVTQLTRHIGSKYHTAPPGLHRALLSALKQCRGRTGERSFHLTVRSGADVPIRCRIKLTTNKNKKSVTFGVRVKELGTGTVTLPHSSLQHPLCRRELDRIYTAVPLPAEQQELVTALLDGIRLREHTQLKDSGKLRQTDLPPARIHTDYSRQMNDPAFYWALTTSGLPEKITLWGKSEGKDGEAFAVQQAYVLCRYLNAELPIYCDDLNTAKRMRVHHIQRVHMAHRRVHQIAYNVQRTATGQTRRWPFHNLIHQLTEGLPGWTCIQCGGRTTLFGPDGMRIASWQERS